MLGPNSQAISRAAEPGTRKQTLTADITEIDQIWVGKELGVREFVVDDELVDKYTTTLGLPIRTAGEVASAPPIALTDAEDGFEGNHFANRFGELWVRQEWHFTRALRLGQMFTVQAKVADVYERRERTVVATEHLITGDDGTVAAKSVHHNSFLLGQSGGEAKLPDPNRRKPGSRHPEPTGESIGSGDRVITPEMCRHFYAHDSNYHTDRSAAQDLGFSEVVIGAGMTMAYLSDLMTARFGNGWLKGGSMDLKFINVLHPDEPFTCEGIITGYSPNDGRRRAEVALSARKTNGPMIIVGTASALVD